MSKLSFYWTELTTDIKWKESASVISTCVQLLEGLVCEECDPCIRDDTQDSGSEASVKGLHTFLLGDPHKDVHDVAVPVQRKKKK